MNHPGTSVTGQVAPVRVTVVEADAAPTVPEVKRGQLGLRTDVVAALDTMGWFLPFAKIAWWPMLPGFASEERSLWRMAAPTVLLHVPWAAFGWPDGEA